MYLELAENNFPYTFVPLRDGSGFFIHNDKLSEMLSKKGRGKEKLKKLFKGVKKIGLSVPRNSFLGLLELNIHGLATKLQKAIDKGKEGDLKKLWEKLGGNYNKLKSAIGHGKSKKALAEDFLSLAPAAAAAATTSAPIIVSILDFLKKHVPEIIEEVKDITSQLKKDTGGELPENPADPAHEDKYETQKEGIFGLPTPVVLGGLALVAILLLRKK